MTSGEQLLSPVISRAFQHCLFSDIFQ